MKSSLLSLAALPLLAEANTFCNAFSTGPVANGTFISTANSTLIVPSPPNPQNGLLALWTGMGTSNGDLVQAVVLSYGGSLYKCGDLSNKYWCTFSSTLDPKRGQIEAREVKVKAGDHVKQSYIYNPREHKYDQYTYVNGKLASTLRTHSGHALGWGTAEECQPNQNCGIVPAHDWVDTTLVFAKPDPSYGQTIGMNGATGSMVTHDGGKTWTASKIHINECDMSGGG